MKYSSTVRIINLVIFLALFAGFVSLGIWAGILVTPFMIQEYGPIDLPDMSVALPWELGAFGLAGALVSLVGFGLSLKSVIRGNNDKSVVDSFSCYIGLGFIIALFLFLNGTWLYRLTTTNFGYSELGFAIAFFLVLAVIITIGVNVPFVKMHGDDVNQNSQMSLLSLILLSVNFGIAVPGLIACVVTNGVPTGNYVMPKLLTVSLTSLVACLFSLVALLGYRKGEKTGAVKKFNGLLFEGGLVLDGAGMIGAGVFSYVFAQETASAKTSFISSAVGKPDVNYLDFSIMSWILGGLLVLTVLVLVSSTLRPGKGRRVAE